MIDYTEVEIRRETAGLRLLLQLLVTETSFSDLIQNKHSYTPCVLYTSHEYFTCVCWFKDVSLNQQRVNVSYNKIFRNHESMIFNTVKIEFLFYSYIEMA